MRSQHLPTGEVRFYAAHRPTLRPFEWATRLALRSEILAHIGDLLDWTLNLLRGQHVWKGSEPDAWEKEVGRFFESLGRIDAYLVSEEPLGGTPEKLFQGPIADAFTHVGQIAMLRRLAGSPVSGENYFKADIVAGRVGPDQTAAQLEFG